MYQASLVACRYDVERVLRPEIYQTEVARRVRKVSDGDWHLAVKPIEHIRPFHGIPNVFVCDWPYPELSTSSHGVSPFFDQVSLLKRAAVVVCCTDFTTRSLSNAGIERVLNLPPYIPRQQRDGSACDLPTRKNGERTFLAVADVDRLSQQLGRTVEGFAMARAQHRNISLLVKLRGGGEQSHDEMRQAASTSLKLSASDDLVAFAFDTPNDPSLGDLLHRADFFICGSAAEGLPSGLIQAMLAGVPLVTTMGAGIGSIVPPGSAVEIPTTNVAADEFDEPLARLMRLTSNRATAEAVCQAILTALDLDDATRARMASTCGKTAEHRFGLAAFRAGLDHVRDYFPVKYR
jgi:glycosyltransferase involved in cell wall biosynthesis